MLERGWEVTACDISAAMVAIARRKVGDRAELSVADMRRLPVFGEFDLVWCLDDAVNYLLSTEELERALTGMTRNLGPEGLLMFDANTIRAYRNFFAEEVTIEQQGRRLLWRGRASADQPPGTIAEASFEVEALEGGEAEAIPPQMHRQRHFTEDEVLAALRRTDLECLDVFGHDDTTVPEQPLDESRHNKAVYISRRRR
jgi:SAM-dependent methyltransferase